MSEEKRSRANAEPQNAKGPSRGQLKTYMVRPGEGLTPIDDPGVPSFYLPIEQRIRLPDDVDVVLDAIFYPGRIMRGPPWQVELRGYLMAEVPGYRAAFVVYAQNATEAYEAAERSADLLVGG